MLNLKNILLVLFSSIICLAGMAQSTAQAVAKEDAGWIRSEAKVYVVGLVVTTILLGLIIYVIRLDRKISKLEK